MAAPSSIWTAIKGTLSAFFRFGKGNAGIKGTSSSVLQARDATDAAFARFQVATPTAGNDATTKDYVDSIAAVEEGVRLVEEPFDFGDFPGTVDLQQSIPDNAVILMAGIRVDSAFDGTTPTATIGVTGNTDKNMGDDQNDLTTADLYLVPQYKIHSPAEAPFITLAHGGSAPTAGSGVFFIKYVTDPLPA